jgi:hypothetical protein
MNLDRDDWLGIGLLAGLFALYLVGILTLRWIWHATGRRRRPVKYLLRFLLFLPVLLPLTLTILEAVATSGMRLHAVFPDVPLSDVTDIESAEDVWSDGDLYVGFTAPTELVAELIRRDGFRPVSDFPINAGDYPPWWKSCANVGAIYWVRDQRGWSDIMLIHCPSTRRVLIQAREPL